MTTVFVSGQEKLNPEDKELFRAAVGEVRPLPDQNRIEPQRPPRNALPHSPAPPHTIPDTLSDFVGEDTPDEFMRNGLSRVTLRKLRRGNWPVQD